MEILNFDRVSDPDYFAEKIAEKPAALLEQPKA